MILLTKLRIEKIFCCYNMLNSCSGLQQKLPGLGNRLCRSHICPLLENLLLHIHIHPDFHHYPFYIIHFCPPRITGYIICVLTTRTSWPTLSLFTLHAASPISLASVFKWNELQSSREAQESFLQEYIFYFSVWFFFCFFFWSCTEEKPNSTNPLRCQHFDYQLYLHPELNCFLPIISIPTSVYFVFYAYVYSHSNALPETSEISEKSSSESEISGIKFQSSASDRIASC